MDMQDNEFDDVFRSKLDGFEAEPSGRVWEGIDEKLDTSRRRAIFMPILRIAASIILVAGLGVLFLVNRGNVLPVKGGKNGLVKVTKPQVKQPETVAPVKRPEPVNAIDSQAVAVNRIAHNSVPKKVNAPVIIAQPQVVPKEEPAIVKPTERQAIAAVEPAKKAEITQPIVPGLETPLSTKTTDNIAQTKAASQVTAQLPATEPTVKPKRRGIHNFGDLVNIVVAKVDKRKDKAIQFTDSDDDESTVTAVNIGPVKINKDTDK